MEIWKAVCEWRKYMGIFQLKYKCYYYGHWGGGKLKWNLTTTQKNLQPRKYVAEKGRFFTILESFHWKFFHFFFSILKISITTFPLPNFPFSNPCHATPRLPSINHIVHNSHISIFFGSLHLVMTLISDKIKFIAYLKAYKC